MTYFFRMRRSVIALFVSAPLFAQAPLAKVADDLRACAVGLSAGMPHDKKSQETANELRSTATALAQALTGKTSAPAEYATQLNELVGSCRPMLMGFVPGSAFGGTAAVAAAANTAKDIENMTRDIGVKSQDSARVIPIEARTFKSGRQDDGWTVYIHWAPAPANVEKALAAPTPGATGSVPPGHYVFRAEKVIAGKKVVSQPKVMSIGSYPKVQISITVP